MSERNIVSPFEMLFDQIQLIQLTKTVKFPESVQADIQKYLYDYSMHMRYFIDKETDNEKESLKSMESALHNPVFQEFILIQYEGLGSNEKSTYPSEYMWVINEAMRNRKITSETEKRKSKKKKKYGPDNKNDIEGKSIVYTIIGAVMLVLEAASLIGSRDFFISFPVIYSLFHLGECGLNGFLFDLLYTISKNIFLITGIILICRAFHWRKIAKSISDEKAG